MKKIAVFAAAGLMSAVVVRGARAAEFSVVGNFGFLGGQYFFGGAPSSLSGNASLSVSPSVKFDEKFVGIFTYAGSYRGSKEVAELAGGGTLFQDAQSHTGLLKFVAAPSKNIKIRPVMSFRRELLRETSDERWTKGLFDYDKISAGAEAEYEFSKNNAVALGADFFTLTFPNYKTLESQQTADLGREQSQSRALDSVSVAISLRASRVFGKKFTARVSADSVSKNYPEQPVATSLDALSPTEKRSDAILSASAEVSYPVAVSRGFLVVGAVGCSYVRLDSNQNRADARKAVFARDYYDYTQAAPSANIHFLLGEKPAVVSVGTSMSSKNYSARPVQDESGNYGAEKIRLDETVSTLTASYPLSRAARVLASASYLKSSSNMKYETVYKYNYDSSNYFLGFGCDF